MADRSNTGILFQNDRKSAPNQPDHTGKLELGRDLIKWAAGEIAAGRTAEVSLAAWVKRGAKGDFLSLKASEPRAKSSAPRSGAVSQGDDDPPF